MINKFRKIGFLLVIGAILFIGKDVNYASACTTNAECTTPGEICDPVSDTCKAPGKPVTVDSRAAGVIPDTALKDDDANFLNVVQTVINWILGFLGIIVFGLFLMAGFTYATAGGDETKTKKAVSTMTNAVIGLIILFFAFAATNLIVGFALNVQ